MIKSADANGSARGTARALAFVSMTFLGLANMAPTCNGGGRRWRRLGRRQRRRPTGLLLQFGLLGWGHLCALLRGRADAELHRG